MYMYGLPFCTCVFTVVSGLDLMVELCVCKEVSFGSVTC